MTDFPPRLIREYDFTDSQRRDRRALLAVCIVSIMDIYTDVVQEITAFGVKFGEAIPAEYRHLIYAIAIFYLAFALGTRHTSQLFGGRTNELIQNQGKIRGKIEGEIEAQNPHNQDHPDWDDYGIQKAIDKGIATDRRRYATTLVIRTILDVVGPICVGVVVVGLNLWHWRIVSGC